MGEEDPGDLVERGVCLAAQVQDGGPQEGHAQAETEEGSPVGEGGLQVASQQLRNALIQQLHVATVPAANETRMRMRAPTQLHTHTYSLECGRQVERGSKHRLSRRLFEQREKFVCFV